MITKYRVKGKAADIGALHSWNSGIIEADSQMDVWNMDMLGDKLQTLPAPS